MLVEKSVGHGGKVDVGVSRAISCCVCISWSETVVTFSRIDASLKPGGIDLEAQNKGPKWPIVSS